MTNEGDPGVQGPRDQLRSSRGEQSDTSAPQERLPYRLRTDPAFLDKIEEYVPGESVQDGGSASMHHQQLRRPGPGLIFEVQAPAGEFDQLTHEE